MKTEQINYLRQKMLAIVKKTKKGHLGTSLSSLEIIRAVREVMREKDIFISSKGHDALAQYVVLAAAGILDEKLLDTFRQEGGLPGHPTVGVPGIVANTGSLGMGLSKALGFAMGRPDRTVYVLLGDGEMMEGQNWEAALAIGNLGIKNIVALVDYNGFSQDGETDLSAGTIDEMFYAAGWITAEQPEGNEYEIVLQDLYNIQGRGGPWAIIFHTTKGKGAEFEGQWYSHFGPPGMNWAIPPQYVALGNSVRRVMEQDERVILVGADTLRDLNLFHLKDQFPKRVYDFGIAEQNAVSFASARALMGEIPIVATYACFLRRAFEQIYNQVTEGTNVIYIGTMAGPLDPSGPGISHQSLDDDIYMNNLMPVTVPTPDKIYGALNMGMKEKNSLYVRILA